MILWTIKVGGSVSTISRTHRQVDADSGLNSQLGFLVVGISHPHAGAENFPKDVRHKS